MAEKPPDANSRFYDALKNSQPLAFLASLSMVIATFSATNKDLPNVYSDAVVASTMFFISFVISLLDQFPPKQSTGIPIFPWGKFFFFGIGIFYLALIAAEFAKSIPQIYDIYQGWVVFVVGAYSASSLFYKKDKSKPTFSGKSLVYKLEDIFTGIFAIGFLTTGLLWIGHEFILHRINKNDLATIQDVIIIISIISLGITTSIIFYSNRKKKKTNLPN